MALAHPIGNYGRQINRLGLLDLAPRAKSRAVALHQSHILGFYGRLPPGSVAARLFARTARRVVGGFLYSLKIEVNNRCPMNCRICYVRKGETEIPLEDIRKLYRSIRACGVRIEILGGEPLLRGDLIEIIRSAKHEARSPFITLYTNAALATPRLASDMKAAGLDGAIVSFWSHRESVHDALTREPGSWAAAVRGMRRLTEAGIAVYTFTPVLRHNVEDVPEIHEFVRSRLRANPLFYQYIPVSRDDELNIQPEDWRRVKGWIMDRTTEHWDFVRSFYTLTGNSCSGGNFVLTVKADGSVQPCPFVDDVPMGNIHRDDIWTIYRRRFRNPLLRAFKTLPIECQDLLAPLRLRRGCRASARWCGGYARRDPKCLGIFSGPVSADGIMDCIPTFF
ncbi:MAG: radical SAM protein [Candidatus Moduliflexus flocculans]|nr:radical SAM protein [Candidatus Moduliflexus flocculans]